MTYQQIVYTVSEGIAHIELNRPAHKNAISERMTREIGQAIDVATNDHNVRVVILSGRGSDFSSGHDLGTSEAMKDYPEKIYKDGLRGGYRAWMDLDVEACLRVRQCPKPTVAVVSGWVVFHAVALMSSCDVVFASETTKILPGLVEMNTLWADVGVRKAKEILFERTAIIDAQRALSLGIVNRVHPQNSVVDEARKYCIEVAKGDPFHLEMIKQAMNLAQNNYENIVRAQLLAWTSYVGATRDKEFHGTPFTGRWSYAKNKKLAPTKVAEQKMKQSQSKL